MLKKSDDWLKEEPDDFERFAKLQKDELDLLTQELIGKKTNEKQKDLFIEESAEKHQTHKKNKRRSEQNGENNIPEEDTEIAKKISLNQDNIAQIISELPPDLIELLKNK